MTFSEAQAIIGRDQLTVSLEPFGGTWQAVVWRDHEGLAEPRRFVATSSEPEPALCGAVAAYQATGDWSDDKATEAIK